MISQETSQDGKLYFFKGKFRKIIFFNFMYFNSHPCLIIIINVD